MNTMYRYCRRNFDNMRVSVPRERVFSRLGYNSNITEQNGMKALTDLYIDEAEDYLDLKAVSVRLAVRRIMSDGLLMEDGTLVKSTDVARKFQGSVELLFIAATSGEEIVSRIISCTEDGDMTKSVVFNAVASEITDHCLNVVLDVYRRELLREGKSLDKFRYSPGYGDLELSFQSEIDHILDFKSIGVKLNSSFMMLPEKSVTALCGIYQRGSDGQI